MTEQTFLYVLYSDVLRYSEAGWEGVGFGPCKGAFSILMKWAGEGNPREPERFPPSPNLKEENNA